MSESISYKGYVVRPTPKQLAETGEWYVDITIEKHHGDHVNTRPFSAAKPTFKLREEAVMGCYDFGKGIIDNRFDNVSVFGL